MILSAGTIGTPRLLLLSGIGPSGDLSGLAPGFPIIADVPSVGRNYCDHIFVPNIFQVNGTDTLDGLLRDPAQLQTAINQWTATKTGVIADGRSSHLGFFRLPSNSTIFSTVPDPSSGSQSAHWEMVINVSFGYSSIFLVLILLEKNFFSNPSIPIPATGTYMTLVSTLISTTSR